MRLAGLNPGLGLADGAGGYLTTKVGEHKDFFPEHDPKVVMEQLAKQSETLNNSNWRLTRSKEVNRAPNYGQRDRYRAPSGGRVCT